MADWFEALTGFRERGYEETQAKLSVAGSVLRSSVNGRSFGVGRLEMPSLKELRERAQANAPPGAPRLSAMRGEAGTLHRDVAHAGALFQAASQFNLLEMVGPDVTPEHGVTGYANDHTQGPACAIAAGAGTIYRNYLVPCRDGIGQTASRQLDCLEDLGAALGNCDGSLWEMRNGYALCRPAIAELNPRLASAERSSLRDRLRIGVHWDVQVTSASRPFPTVSQAYCSALPVGYVRMPPGMCQPLASLVLEGAYEATLWTAAINAARGGSNVVFLTLVGGGVFANRLEWIIDAMRHALVAVQAVDLDVRIVCYGAISPEVRRLGGM